MAGRRVLVTRAAAQAEPLVALLRQSGAEPVEFAAIWVEPADDYTALDRALRALSGYAWVLFTSANTVEHVGRRLHAIGADWGAFRSTRVAAVGRRTASALDARGATVSYVPDGQDGASLGAGLPIQPGERVLLPQADLADDTVAEGLRRRGAQVDRFVAYRTATPDDGVERVRALLERGELDAVTFASSSAVLNLCGALGAQARRLMAHTVVACIGPVTAQAVREEGLEPRVIARERTIEGLVKALEEYYGADDT